MLSRLPLLSISPTVSRTFPSCDMSRIGIANDEKFFKIVDETAFLLKIELKKYANLVS